jgi:spore maturation protein CgeB
LAGWGRRVFTWHEAADTSLFHPQDDGHKDTDLIWIGNWGDEERTRELNTFLVNPATRLRFRTRIHGVRYPLSAQRMLRERNIDFAGWLPNHHVPHAYARSRATVHVPRRPYVESLPGIPTIRVFEALACGIPLVCAPWSDCEGLFPQGSYLSARDEDEMTEALRLIVDDAALTANLVATGLHAIHERHSCAHRVQELFDIVDRIRGAPRQSTRGFTGTQVAAS